MKMEIYVAIRTQTNKFLQILAKWASCRWSNTYPFSLYASQNTNTILILTTFKCELFIFLQILTTTPPCIPPPSHYAACL